MHPLFFLPVPNFALTDKGASFLAVAESVGPNNVLHLSMALAPFSSIATTGPLVTNSSK